MRPGHTNSCGGRHVLAKVAPKPGAVTGTSGRAARNRKPLLPARKQVIVGLVGADPEPVHIVTAPPRHGPMASSDLGGPDVALAGETKRRMERILAKQAELLVRKRADLFGQLAIAVPE